MAAHRQGADRRRRAGGPDHARRPRPAATWPRRSCWSTSCRTAIDDEADAIIAAIQLNAGACPRGRPDDRRRAPDAGCSGCSASTGVSVALAVALAVLALKTCRARRRWCGGGRRSWRGSRGGWRTISSTRSRPPRCRWRRRSAVPTGNDRMMALAARGAAQPQRARAPDRRPVRVRAGGRAPAAGASAPRSTEVVDGVIEELRPPALERDITIEVTLPAAPLAVRCATACWRACSPTCCATRSSTWASSPRRQVRLGVRRATIASASRWRTPGRGCRPSSCRRPSTRTCAAPGPREPGLGLGLATVRRLVEGHDGRYGVRSRAGAGRAVLVRAARRRPAAAPRDSFSLPAPRAAAARKLKHDRGVISSGHQPLLAG